MSRQRFKGGGCPNCGSHYADVPERARFCSGCGQENHDLNVPLRHLVAEVAEGLLHFDTKSIRTLGTLISRPGFLSAEFTRGRRARYVAPVRLYVFVSFLFFLVLALPAGRPETGRSAEAPRAGLNVSVFGIKADELRAASESDLGALRRAHRVADTRFNGYVLRQAIHLANGETAEVKHFFFRSASGMMFVLMPFFALLLFLIFRKSEPYYVSSLVFSLHYHSFAFLLLAGLMLLGRLPVLAILPWAAPIVLVVYLAVALRTAYRRSWRAAAAWSLVIGLLHLASIVVFIWATAMVAVLSF